MNWNCFPIAPWDKAFVFALCYSIPADEMELTPRDDEQKQSFLQLQFQAEHQHYAAKYPDGSFQIISLERKNIGRRCLSELDDEIRIID